jgi:hypothetical protein
LNGTQQLLVYADDVNVLSENINTVKRNIEALLQDRGEVGLEVNIGRTSICYVSSPEFGTKL